jgi:hypothetical protein
MLMKEQGSA